MPSRSRTKACKPVYDKILKTPVLLRIRLDDRYVSVVCQLFEPFFSSKALASCLFADEVDRSALKDRAKLGICHGNKRCNHVWPSGSKDCSRSRFAHPPWRSWRSSRALRSASCVDTCMTSFSTMPLEAWRRSLQLQS